VYQKLLEKAKGNSGKGYRFFSYVLIVDNSFRIAIIMLLTDNKQQSMVKRIEHIVSILMEERPLFKEDLDYREMVQDLLDSFQRNLSFEEFNAMSDNELKKHSSGIMAIELLGKIGEAFTPEQMAIFEDAIKRK
jgi:hypothetical protein